MIDLDEHPEDGRRGVELLQTWERENGRLPETWTATTGSGGRHLFFKLQGSMKRQQHLYDNQVDFQTDGALVILPPTIHAKTGRLYKWDIAPDQRPLAVYDDQAAAFIDEGYLEARGSVSGPRFEAQKEVTAGGRTDYLFRMLSSLQAKGLTDAAIRAAVSAENDSVCVPPLSDQELEREVFSALQRFEKGALSGSSSQKQAKSKAPLSLDLVSLDNVPEERPDWLIPGYIPRYQITTLAGDGGSGKTTVWCNIAAAVSSGRPCFIEHGETVQREPGTVMLRNEKYLGEFYIQDVKLNVEPIIDQATFLEAARHFKTSRNNAAGRAKVNYLLSCKMFCGYCGSMISAEAGTGKLGKVYRYYKCGDKKRGKACELKPFPKDHLEDAIILATVNDMLTDDMIEKLTVRILEVQEQENADDPVVGLRRRLDSNKKRQRNLLDAIEEGGARGLVSRLAALEEEEEQLVLEIQRAEIKRPRLTHEVVEAWLRSFRVGDVTDDDFRARLVDTFIARVELRNDEALIFYNIREKGPHSRVRVRPEWWSRVRQKQTRHYSLSDLTIHRQ